MTPTKKIDATAPTGPAPAIRVQGDGKGDAESDRTGISFTDEPLITRQEFKDEQDINLLLDRFGVTQLREPIYGATIDYDLDLQTALRAIAQAKTIQTAVPEELQDKYPDWRSVLNATETGQYQKDLADLQAEKADRTAKTTKERQTADALAAARLRRWADRQAEAPAPEEPPKE